MSDGYVTLIATARPKNDQPFPIVLANDIKGGLHSVGTSSEMQNIPSQRLEEGMLCYVKDISTMYQYRKLDDTGELSWSIFNAGSGGSGNTSSFIFTTVEQMEGMDVTSLPVGSLGYVEEKNAMYFLGKDESGKKWKAFGTGTGGGGGGFDVEWGDTPPDAASVYSRATTRATTKTVIWLDSSTPYSLDPAKHKDRIQINYLNMIQKCKDKLDDIERKFSRIEKKLELIEDSKELLTKFAEYTDELSALQIKLENTEQLVINGEQISDFRVAAQETRKETNVFVYTMLDYYNDIMVKIDEEMGLALENSGSEDDEDDDKPTNPSSIALITEDGSYILTEDGLLLLPDGMEEISYSQSTLLTEAGLPLLAEDGSLILLDGYSDKIETNDKVTKDTLMTESGNALLTEDSRRLLLN